MLLGALSIIIKQTEGPVKFVYRFETSSRNNVHGRVITIVIVVSDRWGKHAGYLNNVVPRHQTSDSRSQ